MALGFDKRATATILASLRMFQRHLDDDEYEHSHDPDPHRGHFDDVPPLTSEQIDGLCQEINFAKLKGRPR